MTGRLALLAALSALIMAGPASIASAAAARTPAARPVIGGARFPTAPASGRATHRILPSRLASPIHPLVQLQPTTPALSGFGGTWAPLGPTPIIDEKNCCPLRDDYGPTSGRITSLAVNPINASVTYAGTAGGGVWKTSDGGAHWSPLTDGSSSLAIGALAIDTTGQVLFAGTGEDNRSDSQAGIGILRSTDGGATWSQALGAGVFAGEHIGGLAVDRSTSGATMRVFAASDEGLFVSNDEGSTWTKVTSYISLLTPLIGRPSPAGDAFQIVQDPTVATTFWLSAGDFCNTEAGDILMSTDSGATWSNVTPTTLTAAASRIGLGVGTNGTAYFAAAGCNDDLVDVEKTTDGGAHWSRFPPSTPGLFDYVNFGVPQGDYDNVVAVDPTDGNRAVFGGVTMLATADGGAHFTDIGKDYNGAVIHPDYHAAVFTAANTFYVGNDGGAWQTGDLGTTWTNLNTTLNTIQFWQGSALDTTHLLGGAQDNGSPGHLPGAASLPGWQEYFAGDGGFTAIDPTPSSTTIYTEVPDGLIHKGSSTLSGSATSPYDSFVLAGPCRPGVVPADPACADPTSFVAPFVMDPSNPLRLLAGTNKVYLTVDGGGVGSTAGGAANWTAISPDVTTGTTNFAQAKDDLTTIAIGPAGVTGPVVTGSAFGAVFKSTNPSGVPPTPATWVNITGNLPQPSANPTQNTFNPPNVWITGVAFNPTNPSEAWVTIGGVNVGHVWHTMNAGGNPTTWTDISSGSAPAALGSNVGVDSILVDPTDPSIIYVGTDGIDHSVWACISCGGASADGIWMLLGNGLPAAKVNALTLTRDGNNLIAWTHGRGAWSLPRPATTTFYFAEGYTGAGFSETLSLLMPSHSGFAIIDYYLEGGVHIRSNAPLQGGRVTSVDVNAAVGANHQVSAKVTLPGPGVAERTIHFNLPGQWHGSTDEVGATAPSTEWDFAEGSTLTNGVGGPLVFSEFLTLQNANASAVPVSLNYFTDSGLTPVKTLSLPANSRTTVEVFHGDTSNVTNCIPNGAGASCGVGPGIGGVSVQVKSGTLPIIAERPFYVDSFSFGDGVIQDGHDAFGATAAGSTWNFAEGTTLNGFKEYLTLQNPGSAPASVNLNYFTDSGAHPVKTVTVNAHSRVTVEVFHGDPTSTVSNCIANGPGANCGVGPNIGGVSVQVSSPTVPIVAERPMYLVLDFGTGPVAGAHDVVGATGLGQLFGFAAASTLAGENDYLTVQNPGGTAAAAVTATYYPNSGAVQKTFSVNPNSRVTVEVFKGNLTADPSCSATAGTCGVGAGVSPLGIVVQSTQPILVEKPTYNSTTSAYGATDTLGYGPASF